MDLLHYLSRKPITAVFCPHCYSWHRLTGESTIAEYFDDDSQNSNSFKNYWCDNTSINYEISQYTGFPKRVYKNYHLKVRNETLYFSGLTEECGFDRGKCIFNSNSIEGHISIQDIPNNCVLSKIHNGYLDIFFHIDCHPPFPCSKCRIYGPEEYYYKCEIFEQIMTNNVLYYHEHDIRSHYTIMLGFRFKLEEGDVFNTEKLRRAYNSLKHKLFISQSLISALKKQVYMLQTYILKDSNELQALDTIDKELETLSTKLVESNRKVSKLYGEPEDSYRYSEEYDTSKIRNQAINKIYPSLDWVDYKRRYAIYQKKIRDYIEQKASEVLKTYEGIQSEVSTIKDRIDSISETLKQIQNKHSLKF